MPEHEEVIFINPVITKETKSDLYFKKFTKTK